MEEKKNFDCKLCLFGLQGSGKSSLAIRLASTQFPEQRHDPEIEQTFQIYRTIGGQSVVLHVTDASDGFGNSSSLKRYYEKLVAQNHGYIVVYSVTDNGSFAHAGVILQLIGEIYAQVGGAIGATSKPVCVLVGTKCDLVSERVISPEAGLKMAQDLNCAGFYEISALTGGYSGSLPITRSLLVQSVLPPFECAVQRLQAIQADDICNIFSAMSLKSKEDECCIS
mmetsp:Transcript_8760/g.11782  ORF Transcript_8760/g.11782 Transcript_8760/m.11782 type:complete len:225 (+) Transcript_8760:108-782(+)